MKNRYLKASGLAILLCVMPTSAAMAQAGAAPLTNDAVVDTRFDRFIPNSGSKLIKIDYTVWDEALKSFVFRMGQSLRESAPRPEAGTGSRRIYGHDSRFRLEGNRVLFSYFNPNLVGFLTEYRKDLESTADLVDIARLPKNEQLAFWLNLHNAAVIEQIALAYPVSQPSSIEIGDSGLPLDEAPFITVSNVKMSLKDIRTKIVYRHWRDPKVMYGFFRGEVGGPSIQAEAFRAGNVDGLLDKSAKEFVNSLRGVQKSGKAMLVSQIYEEARPYLFPAWQADLKRHLLAFAEEDVTEIINKTSTVRPTIYEADIADLAKGQVDPNYNYVTSDGYMKGMGLPTAIKRLLAENNKKIDKIIRRNERTTSVYVGDDIEPDKPVEVE